jgi:arylsulfatase A-like enzyme
MATPILDQARQQYAAAEAALEAALADGRADPDELAAYADELAQAAALTREMAVRTAEAATLLRARRTMMAQGILSEGAMQ